ncbi:hypothetical protein V1515DRAFT_597867 [Lipomyces mesembrius]
MKGAEMMMHSSVLLQAEGQAVQAGNQAGNQAANQRHRRPAHQKRLQHEGTLTVQEGLDLIQRIEVDKQTVKQRGRTIRNEAKPMWQLWRNWL